jgi:hypothetical protein
MTESMIEHIFNLIQFNPLNVEEFIDHALVKIAPIWVGKVLQGAWINNLFKVPDLQGIFINSKTKAREGIIKNITTWKKFSDSCFVPHSQVNDWSHGIYKLKDFLLLTSISEDTRFNCLESEDNLEIVTAYHTSIKKRVIVDGFHRATALETEIKNGKWVTFSKGHDM